MSVLEPKTFEVADEAQMLALGERLGVAAARSPALAVFLEGDLGAGKTTLSRGWLAGMGYAGRVKSPTYTLLEPYELPGGARLTHLDLYRLADPEELEFLGVRELSGAGQWLLVEWPDKGAGHLPAPDAEIRIGFAPGGGRRVEILARTGAACRWMGFLK